jgi:hypothetical protein
VTSKETRGRSAFAGLERLGFEVSAKAEDGASFGQAHIEGEPIDDIETDAEAATEAAFEARERRQGGQGYSTSAAAIRAVERCAMDDGSAYFMGLGFNVVEHGKPFNLEATENGETNYVEVKGTTTDGASVFLTRNEVAHLRANHPNTTLFILHGVKLGGTAGTPEARGGIRRVIDKWRSDDADLEALSYKYTLPGE